MPQAPYIKLLNARARSAFKERGLMHYKPATWLDDQGWWAGIVEFQSSSRGDGAFLNVGVSWLFYPKDYLSFDLGHREIEFTAYEGTAEFAPVANRFVECASQKVDELRSALRTTATARIYMDEHPDARPDDLWNIFYRGVLAGLSGDESSARSLLETVALAPPQWDWERERARQAEGLLAHSIGFRVAVRDLVTETRRCLSLPARDLVLE